MKPLSQSLDRLAGRVKVLEDSATATFEADRATLEARCHEIDKEVESDVVELESAVQNAAVAGRTWWSDTKASMKRPFNEMQANIEKRQSEHEVKRAVREAEEAEEDAAAAIEVAADFLNVAEYAVITAALARLAADDLSAGTTAPTAGATS